MSVENGKVCCNCRHCVRYPVGNRIVAHCECEITRKRLGYVHVMEGWCRRWAKDKERWLEEE